MSATKKVVLLGVGQTARALAKYLSSDYPDTCQIWGTTRAATGAALLDLNLGIQPILLNDQDGWQQQLQEVCNGAFVLVSFPPDGVSDQLFSDILLASQPQAVVYISSTGVYGKNEGVIDESTPVDLGDSRALLRVKAEEIWSSQATILRAPGLYQGSSGLHLRLLNGSYRLPGDGSNYVSRIHLDDLAMIIAKAFFADSPSRLKQTYVVGDLKPTTHLEVVTWLCQRLSLPMPPSAPLTEVNPTLRGNRQIRATKILRDLDLELKYPTYVEGFSQCLASKN